MLQKTYSGGAERKCLEDVASTTDAAIDKDGKVGIRPRAAGLQRRDDINQILEPRAGTVELPTTMVTEDNSLHTCLERQDGVLRSGDTLEHDGH